MRYPDSLKSQRGSSIVEFLICAPIVALLTYVTYDLNRRIENQQTVTIASRNAVLLGDAFSQDRLESNARAQLAIQGQIMDQAEKSLVLRSNNSANGSGLFTAVLFGNEDVDRRNHQQREHRAERHAGHHD